MTDEPTEFCQRHMGGYFVSLSPEEAEANERLAEPSESAERARYLRAVARRLERGGEEFCQRHLGGFIGPNFTPLTLEEQSRVLTAARGEREATQDQMRRLCADNPHMPVMAQEVTARDARIAELVAAMEAWQNSVRNSIRSLKASESECDDLRRRLAESEEIARIRSDHIAVLEAENADQSRRLADLENRATVKGYWTAPVVVRITEGPAPIPQNALDHSA